MTFLVFINVQSPIAIKSYHGSTISSTHGRSMLGCFPIPPQAAAVVESRATTETQNSMAIQSSASAGAVGAASSLLSAAAAKPVGYFEKKQESLSP
jgi:hypothetical protein